MRNDVKITKRVIDVSLALVGLLLVAPVLPLVIVAIYLDSPGPIIFRQRRAGRLLGAKGRTYMFEEFEMYKFRTMRVDAERETGAILARVGDPRVTKVGRFLRKSRLDEVPQLVNVLFGSMSIVGPRPERPELLNNLACAIPMFEERMRDVKPGITGLAQVSLGYTGKALPGTPAEALQATFGNPYKLDGADGSEADDMRMKLLFDLAYVTALEQFWSYLRLEMSIIINTPLVMLKAMGR